ncbi:MAG: mandelate racemase/muconate lactonizing enzyme family protein [Chloroflexi bacterium]|nr:mandelate racemase/muconate lactonizing enzyme family protein [Chloroflexota bacterium]
MKISQIDLIHLDVPFTPHTNAHMQYWLPHWRISQICKLTLENGIIGWGETLPNYTWAKVPTDIAERVVGRDVTELLWQDDWGGGVQMAAFDAVGKLLNVPAHHLLGKQLRTWCPISWWAIDMPPQDWAQQCQAAVQQGYMSAKLKARTWFDLHAAVEAICEVVPEGFLLDLDFNATLWHDANAVKLIKSLEQYDRVAMIETPIPQTDLAGNAHIRQRTNRPLAMHFGSPALPYVIQADAADGFVVCAGAATILKQAAICEEFNKPFWLQLVGTGITTSWAAHLGAVLSHALWPAVTCMNIYGSTVSDGKTASIATQTCGRIVVRSSNSRYKRKSHIYESQLITTPIEIQGGLYPVPQGPGLGIEVDQQALQKYRVDYDFVPLPKHLYRYVRATGEVTYYNCTRQALHQVFPADAQPAAERGAGLEVVPDDGSAEFQTLYDLAQRGPVHRRESR